MNKKLLMTETIAFMAVAALSFFFGSKLSYSAPAGQSCRAPAQEVTNAVPASAPQGVWM